MTENSKVGTAISWALQIIAAVAFLFAGGSKLAGAAPMVQLFDTIGIGQWFRYLTGAIEVLSAILLLLPARAAFGAVLLICTMVGAILTHLFILHTSPAGPVGLLAAVSIVAWLRRAQLLSVLGGAPRASGR